MNWIAAEFVRDVVPPLVCAECVSPFGDWYKLGFTLKLFLLAERPGPICGLCGHNVVWTMVGFWGACSCNQAKVEIVQMIEKKCSLSAPCLFHRQMAELYRRTGCMTIIEITGTKLGEGNTIVPVGFISTVKSSIGEHWDTQSSISHSDHTIVTVSLRRVLCRKLRRQTPRHAPSRATSFYARGLHSRRTLHAPVIFFLLPGLQLGRPDPVRLNPDPTRLNPYPTRSDPIHIRPGPAKPGFLPDPTQLRPGPVQPKPGSP
ncbi:hypothetical protein PIB30_092749 [Stylosanthes scabra]|uniref:Uncharacterized protein n=1 Tax=Stylosanthes scabra TaxID=79078 RepID=A0ABU6ZTK0_9FABA|nr:hypothetical protein [Stylosanthes scabra]